MEQLASERSRYLRVSQGVFSVHRRRETEKSADDNICKSAAADALLHAASALGNSYGRIILLALRPVKFPRLRERPFFGHLSRAAVKIKCVAGKTEPPHRADGERRPAIISAHRAMVGPVGKGGSGVFKAHRAHPVAHEQFTFDEACHFTPHDRCEIVGQRIPHIDEVNAMA